MNVRRTVLVGIVASALMLAGCTALLGTPVPDVKGKTPDQAAAALKDAGFLMGTVSYDATATGAPGAVILQSPAAGERSKEGAPVNVTVAGPEPVLVPSVVGQTQEQAAAALAAVGLSLGDPILQNSTTAPSGTVMQQEPVAGTQVPSGTAIGVVVSKGAAKATTPSSTSTRVKVPALKGLKLSTAKSKLNSAGLKWKAVTGPGDGMTAANYVYKQSPASGTSVDKGSTVSIYYWTGP